MTGATAEHPSTQGVDVVSEQMLSIQRQLEERLQTDTAADLAVRKAEEFLAAYIKADCPRVEVSVEALPVAKEASRWLQGSRVLVEAISRSGDRTTVSESHLYGCAELALPGVPPVRLRVGSGVLVKHQEAGPPADHSQAIDDCSAP